MAKQFQTDEAISQKRGDIVVELNSEFSPVFSPESVRFLEAVMSVSSDSEQPYLVSDELMLRFACGLCSNEDRSRLVAHCVTNPLARRRLASLTALVRGRATEPMNPVGMSLLQKLTTEVTQAFADFAVAVRTQRWQTALAEGSFLGVVARNTVRQIGIHQARLASNSGIAFTRSASRHSIDLSDDAGEARATIPVGKEVVLLDPASGLLPITVEDAPGQSAPLKFVGIQTVRDLAPRSLQLLESARELEIFPRYLPALLAKTGETLLLPVLEAPQVTNGRFFLKVGKPLDWPDGAGDAKLNIAIQLGALRIPICAIEIGGFASGSWPLSIDVESNLPDGIVACGSILTCEVVVR